MVVPRGRRPARRAARRRRATSRCRDRVAVVDLEGDPDGPATRLPTSISSMNAACASFTSSSVARPASRSTTRASSGASQTCSSGNPERVAIEREGAASKSSTVRTSGAQAVYAQPSCPTRITRARTPAGRRRQARRRRRTARREARQGLSRALARPRTWAASGSTTTTSKPASRAASRGCRRSRARARARAARRATRGSAASRSPRARAGASLLAQDGDRPGAERGAREREDGGHGERPAERRRRLPEPDQSEGSQEPHLLEWCIASLTTPGCRGRG